MFSYSSREKSPANTFKKMLYRLTKIPPGTEISLEKFETSEIPLESVNISDDLWKTENILQNFTQKLQTGKRNQYWIEYLFDISILFHISIVKTKEITEN